MEKALVVLVATAVSLLAAQKVKESQENKNSWQESTDSI